MCGRFSFFGDEDNISKEFEVSTFKNEVIQSYNIAPTNKIGVIIWEENKNVYAHFKWGLVPAWSKDDKIGSKMINCRSETITEKPSFKNAFKSRRCLIPTNGFYEWKSIGKSKIPYFIHFKDNQIFGFAGLWEKWNNSNGDELYTFTIITTNANNLISSIHDRSPVIIDKENRHKWLNQDTSEKDLQTLLVPHTDKNMEMYQVSNIVNNPNNNSQKCIEKMD